MSANPGSGSACGLRNTVGMTIPIPGLRMPSSQQTIHECPRPDCCSSARARPDDAWERRSRRRPVHDVGNIECVGLRTSRESQSSQRHETKGKTGKVLERPQTSCRSAPSYTKLLRYSPSPSPRNSEFFSFPSSSLPSNLFL